MTAQDFLIEKYKEMEQKCAALEEKNEKLEKFASVISSNLEIFGYGLDMTLRAYNKKERDDFEFIKSFIERELNNKLGET
jgi:hypothetical protein